MVPTDWGCKKGRLVVADEGLKVESKVEMGVVDAASISLIKELAVLESG